LKISYFEPPVIFYFDKLSLKFPVGITAPIILEDATYLKGSGGDGGDEGDEGDKQNF
jgi:hypothetical protein